MPLRDLDYAAIAVTNAIREKFGHQVDLTTLQVTAGEATLSITDGEQVLEGSRDQLLAKVRRCGTYAELWP